MKLADGPVTSGACNFLNVKRRRKPSVDPRLKAIFAAADAMTAGGQEPRRHHIVPRFYLERWAENSRVRVTDLDAHKSHTVDPKNAIVEIDFYRVPAGSTQGSASPVVWEAWLSQIEGDTKRVFDKIDSGGSASLDDEDLGALSIFIGVQFTRGRWARYQARWMASVGVYRAYEMYRPGAIAARLEAAGENPTAERVAEVEAFFENVLADPWQMRLSASEEMANAQRSAVGLAEALVGRRLVVYEIERSIITCDEPVVSLWEHMGADHNRDGGFVGTPVIVLPLDPHHVAALFRENMPIVRDNRVPLEWRDALDLNRAIAGNTFRQTVSEPSNPISSKLFIPEVKEPVEMVNHRGPNNTELLQWKVVRRWSGEVDAPVQPVKSWWPAIVPQGPPPPTAARLAAERRMWEG